MTVVYLALSLLVPDAKHPRHHLPRQIKQIARSIAAFGVVVPILVDRNNRIIAGVGRWLAAQLLGLAEVPVIRLEHLTDAQVKALRIADNRLTDLSDWNDQLLAETLKELSEVDLNFDIEATGFTMGEIDLRIEGLTVNGNAGDDPADKIPTPTNQLPVTKAGDLWRLGRHVVFCGSALLADSFYALLGSMLAHIVFCDPPFNVVVPGNVSGRGRTQNRNFAMASGEMSAIEFISFLTRCCALMAKHTIAGSMHFVCMDWRHARELLEAGLLAYTELKNICVWVKDNGGMGSLYRSQHELVFVFKNGTAPHRNNVLLGKYGRNRTNVWNYPCANTFSRQSDEGYLAALHPTVKPVAMVADAIMDCSARGDIVLDPFLGSGTTLIAAERIGRRCYGMEIDPLYVDVIVRRWQVFTGDMAIHTATGKSFDDIAAEVGTYHE